VITNYMKFRNELIDSSENNSFYDKINVIIGGNKQNLDVDF